MGLVGGFLATRRGPVSLSPMTRLATVLVAPFLPFTTMVVVVLVGAASDGPSEPLLTVLALVFPTGRTPARGFGVPVTLVLTGVRGCSGTGPPDGAPAERRIRGVRPAGVRAVAGVGVVAPVTGLVAD
jgi:hypothetical protein